VSQTSLALIKELFITTFSEIYHSNRFLQEQDGGHIYFERDLGERLQTGGV
jgi:hypothetical protein